MEELLKMDIQLIILGAGERKYEEMLKHYEGNILRSFLLI